MNVRPVFYAQKRWGRGRLLQLVIRLVCKVRSHDHNAWHFDWPYDDPLYWQEIEEPMRDPRPDEELTWMRGCERDCGGIQTATATLLQRGGLPGEVTGVPD